ncbi:serine/threonine-protein kinase GRIK2 isoform X2 [Dendrobium catenatum]|uniref:serine/threonine-protein kinase GRIK2 isoform X2 n=1 Tax=Dendrobium catenatum TaxID=906689 RepID=UPI00109F73E6|nr:serine/threonine-protein kinase GRIK2 isoform X2 [Dendrobium catenatum]
MPGETFSLSHLLEMGCCGCFGFLKKSSHRSLFSIRGLGSQFPQEFFLPEPSEDGDSISYSGTSDGSTKPRAKKSEEILLARAQSGWICREVPVKETRKVTLCEDEHGNKMVNEYVRESKIGSGSYGKVVLYRSTKDGNKYAIKVFHKSHLLKLRVAPSETAMNDVLREVSIMKMLGHPNIVNLIEVINDPLSDHFYMVLEYVEGKLVCEGSGPGGIGESKSRRYLRDVVAGLLYLHAHDDNDELRRSPGTPVFTAPECCLGLTYHGRAADTWALGVTLYCMVVGHYPFLGETLQETYDKIVNNPLFLPDDINPQLRNLLERLLCKDPKHRITLPAVAEHPWVVEEDGPIPEYPCRHKNLVKLSS